MVSNTINEKCGQNVIAVNFGLLIDRILSLLFIYFIIIICLSSVAYDDRNCFNSYRT